MCFIGGWDGPGSVPEHYVDRSHSQDEYPFLNEDTDAPLDVDLKVG